MWALRDIIPRRRARQGHQSTPSHSGTAPHKLPGGRNLKSPHSNGDHVWRRSTQKASGASLEMHQGVLGVRRKETFADLVHSGNRFMPAANKEKA